MRIRTILLPLALLLLPVMQGCKLMVYPCARAFGSPSEGKIIGIQCYVVDASGQVAYYRLLNSHF